jgi:hypothetical protein
MGEKMYESDRAILTDALEKATAAYRDVSPAPTIAGMLGGIAFRDEIRNALSEAVESCESYKAVAGLVLFNGGGAVLDAQSLASSLFWRGEPYGRNNRDAVDWLIRVMTTRETTGLFKAAIWGISIDQEIALSETSRLMPFGSLRQSSIGRRILERATPCHDQSIWMAHNYFDAPSAAFVEELPNFPYIRGDNSAFLRLDEATWNAHEFIVLAQAACVGQPLAVACWFEYADSELDYAESDNDYTWLLPEIPPHVRNAVPGDSNVIRTTVASYRALPDDQRARLFRSMERFRLSQARREDIDRVLDLALAFEIAVSEQGDNAPPSWKVSVRSAQVIGGPLEIRKQIRGGIGALYELRNQATHGGTLRAKSTKKPVDKVLQESYDLYIALMKRLLSLRDKPDWKSLELGPTN